MSGGEAGSQPTRSSGRMRRPMLSRSWRLRQAPADTVRQMAAARRETFI